MSIESWDRVDPKGDNPKAGADVGKIVNLMAADANRIAMITSGMYFLYGGERDVTLVMLSAIT